MFERATSFAFDDHWILAYRTGWRPIRSVHEYWTGYSSADSPLSTASAHDGVPLYLRKLKRAKTVAAHTKFLKERLDLSASN